MSHITESILTIHNYKWIFVVNLKKLLISIFQSFQIFLKHVEKCEDDLFSRPYVGYTNLEILKLVLDNWEKDDRQAVEDFLKGDNEYQPLIQAAAKGDIEMMKYLINEKGANKMQKRQLYIIHCMSLHCSLSIAEAIINFFSS